MYAEEQYDNTRALYDDCGYVIKTIAQSRRKRTSISQVVKEKILSMYAKDMTISDIEIASRNTTAYIASSGLC